MFFFSRGAYDPRLSPLFCVGYDDFSIAIVAFFENSLTPIIPLKTNRKQQNPIKNKKKFKKVHQKSKFGFVFFSRTELKTCVLYRHAI